MYVQSLTAVGTFWCLKDSVDCKQYLHRCIIDDKWNSRIQYVYTVNDNEVQKQDIKISLHCINTSRWVEQTKYHFDHT